MRDVISSTEFVYLQEVVFLGVPEAVLGSHTLRSVLSKDKEKRQLVALCALKLVLQRTDRNL